MSSINNREILSCMERKTIWIINQYASTPQTGMGGRHYYLIDEISHAITCAYETDFRREELVAVANDFTWDKIAIEYRCLYKKAFE